MDISIELIHKNDFNVAGLSIVAKPRSPELTILWDRLFETGLFVKLMSLGTSRSLGVCYDMQADGNFRYMAGVEVTNVETAKQYGTTVLNVAPEDYYIHPCTGPVAQCIVEGWKQAHELLAEAGLSHSGAPDFEH